MINKSLLFKILVTVLFSANSIYLNAQIQKIQQKGIVTEGNLYNINGQLYSDRIVIKFNKKIIDSNNKRIEFTINEIPGRFSTLRNKMQSLHDRFGDIKFIKQIPSAMWGDTIRIHKKTGKSVHIHDYSQLLTVKFNQPVPLDSTINDFSKMNSIEFAHGPISIVYFDEPNDPDFQSGYQWNLDVINSTNAWNITHGNSAIKIGIVDEGIKQHQDLEIQGNSYSGTHGTWVAGVAGAKTNNSTGIASLSWGATIYNFGGSWDITSLAQRIDNAINSNMDIINMSFGTLKYATSFDITEECPNCPSVSKWVGAAIPTSYPEISQQVNDAINQGIICIASAGNGSKNLGYGPYPDLCDPMKIPFVNYPAAYSGVIGVSGTMLNNSIEEFNSSWNYGDFVDISAPGKDIWTTDTSYTSYAYRSGTSFSAPLVCALTSLILSVHPISTSFTITDVENILKNTADKITAPSGHPYVNGWSEALGYGRINAYEAVRVAATPSAPQNLHFTYSSPDHPSLGWVANSENDLLNYKVYRSYDNDAWTVTGTVSPPTTTFIDYDVDYTKPIWAKSVRYHVKAVDSTSLYSSPSNEIETTGIIEVPQKIAGESTSNTFELLGNYPNPFNPTTKISFSLSEKGYTQLKVYNSIGEEVAEFVNKVLEAGTYSVDFNAEDLPSGVYLYKLTSGQYVETKKMILLK